MTLDEMQIKNTRVKNECTGPFSDKDEAIRVLFHLFLGNWWL